MLASLGHFIAKVLIIPTVFLLSAAGYQLPVQNAPAPQAGYGDFNPTGAGTYYLQSSVSSTQSTITLTSFTEPVSNIAYTMSYLNSSIEYATVQPQTTSSEFVSFTGITQNGDGSATLTGVVRGLGRSYPFTASTTLQLPHPGQSRFILSNPPQFSNQFYTLSNAATSTNILTFSSTTQPRYDKIPSSFGATSLVPYSTLLATAIQGAGTSTETNMGIVQLATQAQTSLGIASSTEGRPLVIKNAVATSSPNASLCGAGCIPSTNSNGFLSSLFVSTTSAYTWTGQHTFVAATSTSFGITGYLNWGGLGYTIGGTRQASSSVLTENGAGSLSWNVPKSTVLMATSSQTVNTATATTTELTVVLPANTLTFSKSLVVTAQAYLQTGNCTLEINIGNGSASSSVAFLSPTGSTGSLRGNIMATSTTAQSSFFVAEGTGGGFGGTVSPSNGFALMTNYSNVGQLYLSFRDRAVGSGTCIFVGATVQQLSNN